MYVSERREGSKCSTLFGVCDDVCLVSFVENLISNVVNTLAQEQNIQD
jgi:hypothetical protein